MPVIDTEGNRRNRSAGSSFLNQAALRYPFESRYSFGSRLQKAAYRKNVTESSCIVRNKTGPKEIFGTRGCKVIVIRFATTWYDGDVASPQAELASTSVKCQNRRKENPRGDAKEGNPPVLMRA